MSEKITISTFNWGPCVVRLKIKEEFRKLLLEEGKKNTEDYSTKLAGILNKETGYSVESRNKILPYLSQYIGVYDQAFERYINKAYEKRPEYVLSALWINYQRPNDFNPPAIVTGKNKVIFYF